MINILISGAEGFVGKNLTKEVIKRYPTSNILLLVKQGNVEHISKLKKIIKNTKAQIKEVDLVTNYGLERIHFTPTLIFHLAGSTDTSQKDHRTNDEGTKNLLKNFDLKLKPLVIYTSTTAVYAGRKDSSRPINYQTIPAPTNEYGRTKLKAEVYLRNMQRKGKIRLAVVRLSTVFGSETREKGLFKMLKDYIKNGSFISRFNWPGRTGLIYVGDVVNILMNIVGRSPSGIKPVTIIACTHSLNLAQISEIMHKTMNYPYKSVKIPQFIWETVSKLNSLSHLLEPILPGVVYNLFWRLNLIVSDALECDNDLVPKKYLKDKPVLFEQAVGDVV